jgi:hypothetical protein
MILTRRVLPLRGSAVRPYIGTSQFWRSSKHLTHAQPLAVRRDSLPLRKHPIARVSTPCRMVWIWTLVGCVLGVLALSLQGAARPVASEVLASLRVMTLRLGASPTLSSPAEWPLLPMAHFASLSDARGMLEDYDIDNDDSSVMSLRTCRPHVRSSVPVGVRVHSATYTSFWPTPYHVRPQLLIRLNPPPGGDLLSIHQILRDRTDFRGSSPA